MISPITTAATIPIVISIEALKPIEAIVAAIVATFRTTKAIVAAIIAGTITYMFSVTGASARVTSSSTP